MILEDFKLITFVAVHPPYPVIFLPVQVLSVQMTGGQVSA